MNLKGTLTRYTLVYDEMQESDDGEYVLHADHAAALAAKDAEIAFQRTHVETLSRSLRTQSADLKRAEQEAAGLRKGIDAVSALIRESHGVYGLHLNGDPSPWDELLSGGRFEEWLADFEAARAGGEG